MFINIQIFSFFDKEKKNDFFLNLIKLKFILII